MCYTTVKSILISILGILHSHYTPVSLNIPSGIYEQALCLARFHASAIRYAIASGFQFLTPTASKCHINIGP